jgi:dual specificity protein kinase YAK1
MKKDKILTVPPETVSMSPDNAEYDLVISRGDYLSKSERQRYMVIDMLGTGTFGQVVRCVASGGEEVAIKVVKSQAKYYHSEMNEVRILHKLLYKNLTDRFVEIRDVFIFKQHLCIVEELLGHNLYTFLKMTRFRGLEHPVLKCILHQILEGITQLSILGITHCDLKPENILIADYNTFKVKIIDFGSAFTTPQGSHFYVQSRYYRAPEVILGIPYGSSCDIWSFGCVAYELYVGRPLFPGKDNADQIGRIHGLFGSLPQFMLEHGSNSNLFFEKENGYRLIRPSPKFTMDDMAETIRAKNNHQEDDAFVSFLLKALHPSHLARPDARTLINNPYFKSVKTGDEEQKVEEMRTGIQQEPVLKQQRHTSTSLIFTGKKSRIIDRRKISVYGISYENSTNKNNEHP